MSKRENDRVKERRKRRRERSRKHSRITNTAEFRTLRMSARHQIARDREAGLWILPWTMAPTGRSRRSYAKASLLGLPPEIRQQIIYEAFDMTELRGLVEQTKNKGEKAAVRIEGMKQRLRHQHETALGIPISQSESDCITMLHRRIAYFYCVSHSLHADMEYVGKLWKKYLEKSFNWQVSAPLKPHKAPTVETACFMKQRKGRVIKGKGPGKHVRRPPKCWRCAERHFNRDPVCPMARYDPEKWLQLTTKRGGVRDELQSCSLFKATKMVFAND